MHLNCVTWNVGMAESKPSQVNVQKISHSFIEWSLHAPRASVHVVT